MVSWLKLLVLILAVMLACADNDHHDDHNEDEHDMPALHMNDDSHPEDDHHQEEEHHQDDGETHEEHNTDDEPPHGDSSDGGHADDDHEQEEKMPNTHVDEHDAFLGDHVNEFKKLKPEEREKKLDEIVKAEVDTDKDGFVSEDELRARLRLTTRTHRRREVEDTLKYHDDNKDGKVSFEEFKKHHYAGENDTAHDEVKETMAQDEKRFHLADTDGDKQLNLEEYHSFYHPVDDERMAKHAIDEQLEKHDKDKDGHISFEEYLHTFNDHNDEAKTELKKDFDSNYDKNQDGKLDREEMRHWVLPDDEFASEEPKKLMKEADDDKDGKLSIDEINKHLDLFMDTSVEENEETEHDEL